MPKLIARPISQPRRTPKNAAEQSHDAGFDEEKLLDVAIGGAKRFEDADFAAALEDRHHQRVDDSERGDDQREAAEDAQEADRRPRNKMRDCWMASSREKAPKPIFLMASSTASTCDAPLTRTVRLVVGGLGGRVAQDVAKVVGLRGAQRFRNLQAE